MPIFRVLAGTHIGPDINGVTREITAAKPGASSPNDTIETHQNLLELNGGGNLAPKFQLVSEDLGPRDRDNLLRERERIDRELQKLGDTAQAAPAVPTTPGAKPQRSIPDLTKMSEKELREWAEDAEIDIETAKTKDQIINCIRKAYA